MKKIIKYLFIFTLSFSLLGCSSNISIYESMLEDLEEQGYNIEGIESVNYGVTLNRNHKLTITYIVMEGTVGLISFTHIDLDGDTINGIVYLNDEETEKDLDVNESALESYKATLEQLGYTEEEMINFAEWYYNENS